MCVCGSTWFYEATLDNGINQQWEPKVHAADSTVEQKAYTAHVIQAPIHPKACCICDHTRRTMCVCVCNVRRSTRCPLPSSADASSASGTPSTRILESCLPPSVSRARCRRSCALSSYERNLASSMLLGSQRCGWSRGGGVRTQCHVYGFGGMFFVFRTRPKKLAKVDPLSRSVKNAHQKNTPRTQKNTPRAMVGRPSRRKSHRQPASPPSPSMERMAAASNPPPTWEAGAARCTMA